MDFREYLKTNIVYLDGGMGTMLQAHGLTTGELPERWNISHPDVIRQVHKAYYDAGSHVVSTNTFGANTFKYDDDELEQVVKAAVDNANAARKAASADKPRFVALDIGPTGKLLEPFGDLCFENAVAVFAKTVKLGVQYGVDLIIIETMSDSLETKAAVVAAKENCDLPILVSNAYAQGGRLMMGATPAAMVTMLEGLGVDAIGANCSFGPKQLAGVADELLKYASVPVFLKPNAGLPQMLDGKVSYDVDADEFAADVAALVQKGLGAVGGCCGTTPAYIEALVDRTSDLTANAAEDKQQTVVSTGSDALALSGDTVVIGNRLIASDNAEFAAALADEDMDYVTDEAMDQQDEDAEILAVDVAADGVDEVDTLKNTVCALQSMVRLPLLLCAHSPAALEAALRHYNGKALVGNIDGTAARMADVFPLVKKYGGVAVVTVKDTNEAIIVLETAQNYGIAEKDIIFDALTADAQAEIAQAFACQTTAQFERLE